MSYHPDYRAACRRVSAAAALPPDEAALVAVVGPSFFAGQVSAQVPEPDVAAAVHMGWLKDRGDHDAGLVGRLVDEGYLAWKTSRGWSHDPEGRHPVTGKAQPSRQLWMTGRTVEEVGPALHLMFREGLEAVRRKAETGPQLLREAYLARHRDGVALDEAAFLGRLSALAAPAPEPAAGMVP